MTKKSILQREAVQYMVNTEMTQNERVELLAWVHDENSVYDHPWYMADENGRSMDYISALREVTYGQQSILACDM